MYTGFINSEWADVRLLAASMLLDSITASGCAEDGISFSPEDSRTFDNESYQLLARGGSHVFKVTVKIDQP